ncbi:MAG: endolytic transglycosylase MltG [Pseudanabaenaceae cyanobacterium bins.68]|nr:endolytic transglycosylase MltG [Pseudanabaenaceae cyanobacterium bins.68]
MTKSTKRSRLSFWLVLGLTGLGWSVSSWWLWAIAPPDQSPKIRITIPPGTPLQSIGDRLQEVGLIRSSFALRVWLALVDRVSLQAGTFDFVGSQPLEKVVDQLQSGKLIEAKFTLREGWSVQQIGGYFEQLGYFSTAEFVAAAQDLKSQKQKRAWLGREIKSLEGYLFPDTYQLSPAEVTPERVINLMLDQFERVALPLHTPQSRFSLHEWVTLASIVEKEAVLGSERSRIAAVFAHRLSRGMRLESDPTVEYGLGIRQTVDQPLTLKQVRTPSPYNTYLNEGLPPGAIAAPGLASLKASLNPPPTKELFFVARYDGSHIFSQTYEQHKQAISQVEQSLN